MIMLKKALATSLSLLAITVSAATSDTANSRSALSHQSSFVDSSESDIDYRHMRLYELKNLLYYNPPSFSGNDSTPTAVVRHVHHHDHWGWGGWGYNPFWGGGGGSRSSSGSNTSDNSESFTDRVKGGVTEVAVTVAVIAIAAAAVYGTSQAVFILWPYAGATSLTAIELPPDSPWKITGYKVGNGRVVTYQHLEGNNDATQAAEDGEMFDREKGNPGRFLIIDQENWWGLTDYPTDIDITFTRSHPGKPNETITVNLLRAVTNGLKPGKVTLKLNSGAKHSQQSLYRLTHHVDAPSYFEFRKWYHRPTRVILNFHPVATY